MKAAYRALVVENGGVYSPELSCQCTHLVIFKRPGQPQEVSAKERWGSQPLQGNGWQWSLLSEQVPVQKSVGAISD